MNSEIPTVLKLSPVTVVKADKQLEPRLSSAGTDVSSPHAVSSNGLQVSTVNATEDPSNDAKKAESNFSLDQVKKAVDEGNSFLQVVKRNLQFKVDEATDELVVKIVDSESGELVRQIPSEEMLAFIERLQEQDGQQGLMIQDRA